MSGALSPSREDATELKAILAPQREALIRDGAGGTRWDSGPPIVCEYVCELGSLLWVLGILK